MFKIQEDLLEEYSAFKKANPNSFNMWSYLNMKSDLQTALGFAHFYSPEVVEIENCIILKDRYFPKLYEQWKSETNDKTTLEKMMNLYEIKDFFHINRNLEEDEHKQLLVFATVIQFYWNQSFKVRYPDKDLIVDVFEEFGGLFITVYEGNLETRSF